MTSNAKLYPYQRKAVSAARKVLRPDNAVVLVAPTGAGKTIMAANIARGFKSTLFVAHRREILEQARLDFGNNVRCASVHIALNQLSLRRFDLLIIDECHRSGAATYRALIEKCGRISLLGLTATPLRNDGQGLCDTFDEIVECPGTRELIDAGYLVDWEALEAPDEALEQLSKLTRRRGDYATGELSVLMNRPRLVGDVVREYVKHGLGRKAICFAVSVKHSEVIAKAFRRKGIMAVHIDGLASASVRREALRDLASGAIEVLCSVDLFTEGWDCPPVSCVIMARPTQSLTLYLQSVGRGLRPFPGKSKLLILDHAGNIDRHGNPDARREWSLESPAQKTRRENEVAELERLFARGFASIEEYSLEQKRMREATYSAEECDRLFGNRNRRLLLFRKKGIESVRGRVAARYLKATVDVILATYGVDATYTTDQCEPLLREFTSCRDIAKFLLTNEIRCLEWTNGLYSKPEVDTFRRRLATELSSTYSWLECSLMFKISLKHIARFLKQNGITPISRGRYPKRKVDALMERLVGASK